MLKSNRKIENGMNFFIDAHIAKMHDGVMPFPCTLCDQKFYSKKGLNKHIKTDHEGVKHCCEFCKKNFASKDSLNVHIGKSIVVI